MSHHYEEGTEDDRYYSRMRKEAAHQQVKSERSVSEEDQPNNKSPILLASSILNDNLEDLHEVAEALRNKLHLILCESDNVYPIDEPEKMPRENLTARLYEYNNLTIHTRNILIDILDRLEL